jgi:chromosome segregation ATPase
MRVDNSFIINTIKTKINENNSLNQSLRTEIAALHDVIKQLNDELAQKTQEVKRLNQELENVVVSHSHQVEHPSKENLTAKIDGMVKEIDRCIALLNN